MSGGTDAGAYFRTTAPSLGEPMSVDHPMSGAATHAAQHELFPRRSWANWVVLAATFVVTTMGMSVIIATLLPDRLANPWPWVRTDLALISACLLMVLTLVLYLTLEQRNTERMRARFVTLNNEFHESARKRLFTMLEMSRVMASQGDPQSVFDCITRSCAEIFTCDTASLMLFDKERGVLVVRSAHGHSDAAAILGQEQALGVGIAGWAAKHERPLIIGTGETLAENPELKLSSKHLCAAMVVPIILRDELVGVVNISTKSPDQHYGEDDMRALKVFAENAGTCIRNTERAHWMRATIDSLRAQLSRTGDVMPL